MQSCLGALGTLAGPLFDRKIYPSGGRHLTQLLVLSLPGIDMNDPQKTMSTLLFITTALMTIPMFDLTNVGAPTSSDGMQIGEEEDIDAIRFSTGEFEGWLALFVDRIFAMVRVIGSLPFDYMA
jgi:proteasome activator subunit 4